MKIKLALLSCVLISCTQSGTVDDLALVTTCKDIRDDSEFTFNSSDVTVERPSGVISFMVTDLEGNIRALNSNIEQYLICISKKRTDLEVDNGT